MQSPRYRLALPALTILRLGISVCKPCEWNMFMALVGSVAALTRSRVHAEQLDRLGVSK